jgi:hypothetical protein
MLYQLKLITPINHWNNKVYKQSQENSNVTHDFSRLLNHGFVLHDNAGDSIN